MTMHLATVDGKPVSPRDAIVRNMASHLLAGVTAGLDLSDDRDVITYLINTPERYRAAVVTFHMDDAIADARQTLIAAMMGRM